MTNTKTNKSSWLQSLPELDTAKMAERITVVLLLWITLRKLSEGQPAWPAYTAVAILCFTAVIFPQLIHKRNYWLGIVVFWSVILLSTWRIMDNHFFLIWYWSIALMASHCVSDEKRLATLQLNARWLVGLCMTTAVLAKLVSPEYMDGNFFNFYLMFQRKFFFLATIFGNVSTYELLKSYAVLDNIMANPPLNTTVPVFNTSHMHFLSLLLSYVGLFIEALIAILFLLPKNFKLSQYRDWSLWLFSVVLYSLVSVTGFSLVLLVMGFTQATSNNHRYVYTALIIITMIGFFARFNIQLSMISTVL